MKMNRKGFTLVEIMIVVLIVGILAAIAIPNFIKARLASQQNACIANLKQIQGAKEQSLISGGGVTDTDLYGPTKFIKAKPVCPGGGNYTTGDATTDPTCGYTAVTYDGKTYTHAL